MWVFVSHLAGFGVQGHLPQPCFMADINPGSSGHETRLDCKYGGGALSSSLLRASAPGTVPDKQGTFESPGKSVCKDQGWYCLFSKDSYMSVTGSLHPIGRV